MGLGGSGKLRDLMNSRVLAALGDSIPDHVMHGAQSQKAFRAHHTDFMKPVTTVGE